MMSSASFVKLSSAGFGPRNEPEESCEQHEQRIRAIAAKIRESEASFKTTIEPLKVKVESLKKDVRKESDKVRGLKVTLKTFIKMHASPDRKAV